MVDYSYLSTNLALIPLTVSEKRVLPTDDDGRPHIMAIATHSQAGLTTQQKVLNEEPLHKGETLCKGSSVRTLTFR